MEIVIGNIFDSKADTTLHQVNCQGAMGGGVAKQVKERYPIVFKWYKQWCDESQAVAKRLGKSPLLGKIQIVYKDDFPIGDVRDGQAIVNLYAQDRYGWSGCYTDYEALQKCLQRVNQIFKGRGVAIPYMMSCARGGGDWNIVSSMIEKELKDCNVTLYKFNG